MKKTVILLMIIFTGAGFVSAQYYETGLGLRLGPYAGVTVKHFANDRSAVEGILTTRWSGVILTCLYEPHFQFMDVNGLMWFVGGGGHAGFWNYRNDTPPWWNDDHKKNYLVAGLDAVIGIEYTFEMIPLSLSIDWKPAINLLGYTGFWGDDVAFSVRYVFN